MKVRRTSYIKRTEIYGPIYKDCVMYSEYARKLHEKYPVVDAHLDLVTAVYRKRQSGETGSLKKYYLEKLREGGVNLVFASLFLGEEELAGCLEKDRGSDEEMLCCYRRGAIYKKSMEMLSEFMEEVEMAGEEAFLVTDRRTLSKVWQAKERGKKYPVGILLYLEGLDMLEGDTEALRTFYELGVRGVALTWNKRPELPNPFAEGCGMEEEEMQKGAITEKGIQVISLIEELGMFVDSSHLSRRALDMLPAVTHMSYAATHSNAAAIVSHQRNLTDEQIKNLTERGGVIGVNTYAEFIFFEEEIRKDKTDMSDIDKEANNKDDYKYVIEGICRQTAYLLRTAGEDYVGFGLDLGEGNCLPDYRRLPDVTARLLEMGYGEKALQKILGENWLRFLWKILR